MKFAFLLTQSLDSPSGLGRYGPLAREFIRHGHEVDLFALHYDWSNLKPKTYVDHGVNVHYVGQMHVRKEGSRKTYFGPGKLLSISINATLQLARALRKSNADIVQICKPQPMNTLAARIGSNGRPIFCDCDDYEAETNLFSNIWQKNIVQYFEDGIIHYVEGITTNTKFSMERYQDLGFPKEKLRYVPNGVERYRFKAQPDTTMLRKKLGIAESDKIIIYIGTLGVVSHPIDILLESYKVVSQVLNNTRLILVGGGEDFDLLKHLTNELDLDRYVIFTGRVPAESVPKYLELATVSVDPIKNDLIAKARSPLKIVESLAVGVPVVTSNVGDRNKLLNFGECGLLVQPNNTQALADGLITMLRDPILRNKMSVAARIQAEKYHWDNLTPEFMKIYDLIGTQSV